MSLLTDKEAPFLDVGSVLAWGGIPSLGAEARSLLFNLIFRANDWGVIPISFDEARAHCVLKGKRWKRALAQVLALGLLVKHADGDGPGSHHLDVPRLLTMAADAIPPVQTEEQKAQKMRELRKAIGDAREQLQRNQRLN